MLSHLTVFVSDACQIKDLDHQPRAGGRSVYVSDACQIKDLDHRHLYHEMPEYVSDACQIKDLDHPVETPSAQSEVSDACQIKDLDHLGLFMSALMMCFRCLSDQRLRPPCLVYVCFDDVFQMPVRSKT